MPCGTEVPWQAGGKWEPSGAKRSTLREGLFLAPPSSPLQHAFPGPGGLCRPLHRYDRGRPGWQTTAPAPLPEDASRGLCRPLSHGERGVRVCSQGVSAHLSPWWARLPAVWQGGRAVGRPRTLRLRCRFLPQQLVYWAQVDWEAPRYRSTTIIANLLGIMKELPSISILEEDVLGHVVVQLAVSLADPEEGIQQKAREVMSQLLTMLLHRRRGE
ncbi:uncharacterized protein LOC125443333 [Sphaerodactylus townsendi]|uniref:uncharacterized protein LOC125443333 n=1 Tax=Sphaerodactylus townsendi TaxID=933632 RepID=UPI0020268F85|nr:uncharacterized protein LOC125443333 [Sphaerodactylus townsendi]